MFVGSEVFVFFTVTTDVATLSPFLAPYTHTLLLIPPIRLVLLLPLLSFTLTPLSCSRFSSTLVPLI